MNNPLLCQACGKPLKRCRYNGHHQKYCKRSTCILRRKQERQRISYNRRYREDLEYQEQKRRYSLEYMRARRQKEREADTVASEISPIDILTGVVSQLVDEDDPAIIRERLKCYSIRGRQLSQQSVALGRSP
jgi:hypothetical protein